MQVKFFVIVVEIDLEDCGTLISDETAQNILINFQVIYIPFHYSSK
jgi:hypothetical protein